jgi:hypothetical protein
MTRESLLGVFGAGEDAKRHSLLGPQRRTQAPRRAEWILAAASAASVLVLAGCAELVLRAVHPGFLRHTHVDHPHVYSETYGWALRAGSHYQGRNGEVITVNSRGYRGREHEVEPAAHSRRVVMLGDSIAFGSGVSDGETFSDRLEATAGFEVVNLAVDGYGTDQELIRLENEGFSYRPRVVVLNFCIGNDYFDNALPVALYDGVSPKPYFTLEGDRLVRHDAHLKIGRATRAAVALHERSYLINALLALGVRRPLAAGDDQDAADWDQRRDAVQAHFPRAVALTRRLVQRAAERCRERGVRFVTVLHPDHQAFAGDSALVTPLVGIDGVRVVDLRSEYRARGLHFSELALDSVGHLNPAGHMAAAAILRALLEAPDDSPCAK